MTSSNRLILLSMSIFLAGCGSVTKSGSQQVMFQADPGVPEAEISLNDELSWVCEAFRPIELEGLESEQASEEVGQQIAEHNAVWHVICVDMQS